MNFNLVTLIAPFYFILMGNLLFWQNNYF